jgi:hypothetical protein
VSNQFIHWSCRACSRSVLLAVSVDPYWPGSVVHGRSGYCEACFALQRTSEFVQDHDVDARWGALHEALCVRVLDFVQGTPGRPKELFLQLGLTDSAARAACAAYSSWQGAASASRRSRRDGATSHLREVVNCCIHPELPLLTLEERELVRSMTSERFRREDTRIPCAKLGTVAQLLRPVEGRHGVFFVALPGISRT